MQDNNITFDEFVAYAKGPSEAGECRVEAYLNDVSNKWSTKGLERVSEHPRYWFNNDGFNVYLLVEIGPDGEYELAGYYHDGAVGVLQEHRGQNLGIELVLKASELRGGSPFNGIESHSFSEAGWAMHVKAYKKGIERGLFVLS